MIYTDNKDFYPTPKALFNRLLGDNIRWLGGKILEPSAGSGSTLVAAKREGFGFIGVELTEEYIPIIEARVGAEATGTKAEANEGRATV